MKAVVPSPTYSLTFSLYRRRLRLPQGLHCRRAILLDQHHCSIPPASHCSIPTASHCLLAARRRPIPAGSLRSPPRPVPRRRAATRHSRSQWQLQLHCRGRAAQLGRAASRCPYSVAYRACRKQSSSWSSTTATSRQINQAESTASPCRSIVRRVEAAHPTPEHDQSE